MKQEMKWNLRFPRQAGLEIHRRGASRILRHMVVSRYLDKVEASTLKEDLVAAGVVALIREHGPARFLWGGIYHQVQVSRKDYEKAKPVAARFEESLRMQRKEREQFLTSQCPQCNSKEMCVDEKKTLLQKLFYAGVTVRLCKECGTRWFT
jgi:hypothetical protein